MAEGDAEGVQAEAAWLLAQRCVFGMVCRLVCIFINAVGTV